MPEISVIVPVYNAEKYVSKCIDSVLEQSFDNFELILVDDGSSDGSDEICQSYAVKDARVRYLRKENGGVSSARNLALDKSAGCWIIFLDADDYWLDNQVLETLYYTAVENNVDLVRGEYISVDAKELKIEMANLPRDKKYQRSVLGNADFIENVLKGEFFLVLNLIRAEIIGNNRFDTGMSFQEDAKFFIQLLMRPVRCWYFDRKIYAYRKIETSASNKADMKKLINSFGMSDFYWSVAESCEDERFAVFCRTQSVMMYYWTLQTVASDAYFYKFKDIIKDLKLKELHKRIAKRIKLTSIDRKYLLFISLPPYIGGTLLHIKDKCMEKLARIR